MNFKKIENVTSQFDFKYDVKSDNKEPENAIKLNFLPGFDSPNLANVYSQNFAKFRQISPNFAKFRQI